MLATEFSIELPAWMVLALTLWTAALLCTLVWFLHVLWQEVWIAWARHRLFALRDRIFHMAADERSGLRFSDRNYREIREEYNAMLRFCHQYDWPVLMVILAADRQDKMPHSIQHDSHRECYERIADAEVREELLRLRKKAIRCLTLQLLLRAHFFNAILIPTLMWTLFRVFHRSALRISNADRITRQSAQLAMEDSNWHHGIA